MTGRNMTSSFSIADVEDDEKSAELVLVSDPSKEKFKKFSDVRLDDEIKKFEDLANSVFCKKLNLKDGGDKIRRQLQRLLGEKSARVQQQCSVVYPAKQRKALDFSPGLNFPLMYCICGI